MEQKVKRREWVKTAAIILLSVLLILTFFSNTIMNRSLPEVATQAVQSGSINAQIRGTGQISADETYDVTINQSRKVQSVHVRVGDEVSTGDVLFVLDPTESSELQSARDTLETMELNYQQALIQATNAAAQENRNIQKLQQAYNEALAAYQMYSSSDPTKLKTQLAAAESYLKTLNRDAQDAQQAATNAEGDETYLDKKAEYDKLVGENESLESQIESYREQLENHGTDFSEQLSSAYRTESAAKLTLDSDKVLYLADYKKLREYAKKLNTDRIAEISRDNSIKLSVEEKDQENERAKLDGGDEGTYIDRATLTFVTAYAKDPSRLAEDLKEHVEQNLKDKDEEGIEQWKSEWEKQGFNTEISPEDLQIMATAFDVISNDRDMYEAAVIARKNLENTIRENNDTSSIQGKIKKAEEQITANTYRINALRSYLNAAEFSISALKTAQKEAQQKVEDQQDYISRLQDAQNAAMALTSAKEALEDATFNLSLEDTDTLRLQNDKEAIDKQKALIEKLEKEADAVEVTARVPGVISAVNVTAGNTANAEMPLATITIKDRGYTVRISCTADQARRVTIGDQAKLSNYYYYGGDVSATLEKILNDPQNPQTGRYLVFRLTGDGVEPGANITLAIGQKSASYEALVPNSAVRNDTNGSYVLVVQEKSTPLSTRYTARRVEVNVLASDDTQTAVTGLSAGDFVILTSSRPIEAGDQVRLPDDS